MNSNTRGNYYMLGLLIYGVVVSLIFNIFTFKYGYLITDKKLYAILLLILSQLLINIVPFFIYLIVTGKKTKDILHLNPISIKNIILIILICLFIQPIMMLLSFITTLFSPNEVGDLLKEISSLPFYITMFAVAVMPAICEEITFRGIILSEYKNLPLKSTFLINGLFFGIMHLTVQQFLYATLLGIVFSYFVHYTKSIFSSILGHFVINGSQVLLMYFEGVSTATPTKFSTQDIVTGFIFLILLVLISYPILRILFKAFKKYNTTEITSEIEYIEDIEGTATDYYNKNQTKFYNLSFWLVILFYILYMLFTWRFN